jgi:hypothetical protein
MAHRIWFDGPTLVITISGTVDPGDLLAIGDALMEIEMGGTYTPHRLVDMREIDDATIGYQEVAKLVDRSRTRPLQAKLRSALLVAQPIQVGFARMFQILNDHPQVTVRIFEDEPLARAWLETGDADPNRDPSRATP